MTARHLLAIFCLAVLPPAAAAEHAVIDLRVSRLCPATDPDPKSLSANADTEPPAGGRNPRPLLKVKLNEPLEFQFILINNYPHGDKKNVAVRFFIVRQEKPRQKTVPDHEGSVAAGSFTMNFKPNCRVSATSLFHSQGGRFLPRPRRDR